MASSVADVAVRPARTDDLADLLSLYRQLADGRAAAAPLGGADAVGRLAEMLATAGRTLLVADDGDRAVGTADLTIVANLTHGGAPWAIVENVVVDETWRNRGVGAALMAEVERRCAEAGCYKIQLLSRKERARAHAFYRRLGYEAVAEGFRRFLP